MGLLHTLSRRTFGPLQGKRKYQKYFEKLPAVTLKGMNYGSDEFSTSGELEVMRHVHRTASGRGRADDVAVALLRPDRRVEPK
jgi:hypothetical protein